MDDQEIAYLQMRAEEELRLAQVAGSSDVVHVHYLLAAHFLERIYSSGVAPPKPPSPLWR